MIELGVGMFGDVQINRKTGKIQDAGQRMQEILEEVKLMDQVGLDFFGIGEHHRKDYAVAAPEILLAAAASVTKNITLGSAVSVISSADPVKLYQDFSMVDLISDGRAEIMAGRGSFTESFPLFGNNMNDYDALFDEKLKLLLQLNENEEVTWQGKFRPPLNKQKVYPQPKNGNIPIWVAVGGTPQSVLRAGKLGLPVMFAIIGGTLERFKPLVEYYRHAWVESGHSMDDFQVGVHMHALFGEDSEEIADWYYPYYSSQMDRIGKSRGWPAYERNQYDFGRSKSGHLIIGDPEYAIDKILHTIELFGLTRFSAHMDVGSPDHKQMMKSIEIFGDKIAPKVRKALNK
ncbi:MAG TPA: LLM class flavin-dependent oxidoreductase [Flavobacteriaceae bacterium]|nr:LLM class flavin-dependent oxidoreductase [Flavobacteriaceae bacterium]